MAWIEKLFLAKTNGFNACRTYPKGIDQRLPDSIRTLIAKFEIVFTASCCIRITHDQEAISL